MARHRRSDKPGGVLVDPQPLGNGEVLVRLDRAGAADETHFAWIIRRHRR